MYNIVALDCSLNSPGFVLAELNDNTLDICNLKCVCFTSVKKFQYNKENILIQYYNKNNFNNYLDQYVWIRDKIKSIYDNIDIKNVAIEDYAFNSVGTLTKLAEVVAAFKIYFYDRNIPIRLYDIGNIKRFATSKGNSDKFVMEEAFEKIPLNERFDLSFLPMVRDKKAGNPKDNIIDAYFIMKFLQTELKVRRGLIALNNLPEHQLKCFNTVTKYNPENLPVRPFIQKENNND